MQTMLENPMVMDRPIRYTEPDVEVKPECDCGSFAKLEINGKLRCYDCAEDEGVRRV